MRLYLCLILSCIFIKLRKCIFITIRKFNYPICQVMRNRGVQISNTKEDTVKPLLVYQQLQNFFVCQAVVSCSAFFIKRLVQVFDNLVVILTVPRFSQ